MVHIIHTVPESINIGLVIAVAVTAPVIPLGNKVL